MKNIIKLVLATFVLGAFFASCSSTSEKVDNAEEKVEEAKEDLNDANHAYIIEMEDYKRNTETQLTSNEQSIVEFKSRISNQKKEAKAEYEKQIDALNVKNSDLKKKMADFKADSESSWNAFKSEFSHDMSELGDAFKSFTIKNEK
jgi:phosphoenolpyruvate-protein kinase (PTS system EI component)